MRKAAGIAILFYCGLVLVFVAAYLLASTEFDLPPGPPIVAAGSVALAWAALSGLTRDRGE